ncbi:MAG: helix-turn-helix domain-containing protein, partial [Alistipes sp.]|nr:helix-turn-helix domain-containing protein [Alistipes sp.]
PPHDVPLSGAGAQFHRLRAAMRHRHIVDSSLVDDNTRHIIDRYTLDYRPAEISPMQRDELERILELIELRQHTCDGHRSAGIIHHLARAAVDIVAEVFVENDPACNAPSSRNRIIAAFNDLLSKHMSSHRRPSYYSDRLNISTVYLNQIVKEATGMNTGNYIRARIMLEAKRMLAHSTLPVNEIATALGFDDHAYFTRAFTLCVGISPASFRRKYID